MNGAITSILLSSTPSKGRCPESNLSCIFEPEVEITTINDYIYFGTDRLPIQNTGTALINKYTGNVHLTLGRFHLENQLIFSNISGEGADAIRVPDWYFKGKWYYKNTVFNNYMEMMLGFNLRWQSAFFW